MIKRLPRHQKRAISTHLIEEGMMTPKGDIIEKDLHKVVSFIEKVLVEGSYTMNLKKAVQSVMTFQSKVGSRLRAHKLMAIVSEKPRRNAKK